TKRPWGTKQRIVSRHGHLSNTETAGLLAEVACERLNHVILSHLSPDCNCPKLASETVRTQLAERGYVNIQVQCSRQDQPSEWVNIS
ncbi:MBL fold metallo-hydrolase, partial [bacterium]|nr:MBL fold metallo-hydrolase [bacterium]